MNHCSGNMMLFVSLIVFFSAVLHESFSDARRTALSSLQSHLPIEPNKQSTTDFQEGFFSQPGNEAAQIPQYMLDLYKKLVKKPHSLPFGADFVRSFTNSGHKMVGDISVLTFKVKIPKNEQITYAILQFCPTRKGHEGKTKPSVMHISDLSTRKWAVRAKFDGSRCLEVPLKDFVKRAELKHQKSTKLVLGIKLYRYNSRANDHMISARSTANQKSVLIVFTKSNNRQPTDLTRNWGPAVNRKRSSEKGCKTKSLFVNFAGLGYRDIIVPTIFDAKQCAGVCNYPLGKMTNPAQHSMIQQLLFSLYGSRVAKSTCCAPRRFAPLTIMLNDTFSNGIVIRSLDDMVVAECGCI